MSAMRVSLNGKRGVAHWFELADGSSCVCLKAGWTYIKSDKKTHVTEKRLAEWDAANPVTKGQSNG
jgi:hypothetical protein